MSDELKLAIAQRDWLLDNLIDKWHASDENRTLHDYLDWSEEQYKAWLEPRSNIFPHPPKEYLE